MKKSQAALLPFLFLLFCFFSKGYAQSNTSSSLSPTPPMGWMSWNYYGEHINEQNIRDMADAMVQSGMQKAGYQYIMIDDGWQGGRDNRNHIIPDPKKFPSGIQALADYVHKKGLKLGIYSDAAPLTCAGYTASLNFEVQDAKTFAKWGIDYFKYDYCNAPTDSNTAKKRYKTMADALNRSGRKIVFSICEWGDREPWKWAANAGGQLWRTTADIRDTWRSGANKNLHGITDNLDINAGLSDYASVGHWNDPDLLVVGLYARKGPATDGGAGCTDIEYQSQMSLWSMMASPLIASCNLTNMNEATKQILLNQEIIDIDQDGLGKQAVLKIKNDEWNVFVKPLSNGDVAVAVLNGGDGSKISNLPFNDLGLQGKYEIRDVWQHKIIGKGKTWHGLIKSHETKVFRLKAA